MGIFGDTAYDLLGFTDPRKKLAAALSAPQQSAAPTPVPPSQFQPTMAQGGTGPDQQNPPPAPPPQPQAYTSGPDFSKMYLDMLNRQEGSDAIDRGMGMLFAGFAQPQDRASMVNAMAPSSATSPGTMIDELQKVQLQQGKIDSRTQLLQNAPAIARQLNMPVEQVIAAINSGAMDNIIQEHDKNTMLQADPLHVQQTRSASTEADLHVQQAQLEKAKTDLANATMPDDIAKAKNEVIKLQAEIEKTRAETGAIPTKTSLEQAQTRAADAAALNSATTTDIKDYQFYSKQETDAGRTPLGFAEFQRKFGGKATPKMGLQVTWRQQQGPDGKPILDENGNPIMEGVQLSDVPGEEPQVVKGATIKAQRTDTGTGWTYVNPYTGQPIGAPLSKNVQTTAEQKASGSEQGKSETVASRAYEATNNTLQQGYATFEQLEKHPGLDGLTGLSSKLPIIPGTDRADAFALQHQAVSVLYNQAVQSLKGVTSRAAIQEINQAAAMQGRLADTSQSAEGYRKAIADAKESIKRIAAINADNAGKSRPDWVGNIDINAPPQQTPVKKGHFDREKGKIVYD